MKSYTLLQAKENSLNQQKNKEGQADRFQQLTYKHTNITCK